MFNQPLSPGAAACRVCGAVQAAPGNNSYAVCRDCWARFGCSVRPHKRGLSKRGRSHKRKGTTSSQFNDWLCQRLIKAAQRQAKVGVSDRCEAVTTTSANGRYQCKMNAACIREGRSICANHRRSPQEHLMFVDSFVAFP